MALSTTDVSSLLWFISLRNGRPPEIGAFIDVFLSAFVFCNAGGGDIGGGGGASGGADVVGGGGGTEGAGGGGGGDVTGTEGEDDN